MGRETLKVLEMVAEGKLSPEEGVRLIEALGEAEGRAAGAGHRPGMHFGMPDFRIPKIDLGQIGEICVELKKTVTESARKASDTIRRGRFQRFFDFKDYPLIVERPEGVTACDLALANRAGKLKLKAGEERGSLLAGKVRRVPEEPTVLTAQVGDKMELALNHSLGRCSLLASPQVLFKIDLSNAAADARLDLTELQVHELSIDNDAGSVTAALGGRTERVDVKVSNDAGNVKLRVPATHALRVGMTSSLSSDNLVRYGLNIVDGFAQSSDWESNPKRVDVTLIQNVASFRLLWKRHDGVSVGEGDDDEDFDLNGDDEPAKK